MSLQNKIDDERRNKLTVVCSQILFNDINERRLFRTACELANVLHEVFETRRTSTQDTLCLFYSTNQIVYLGIETRRFTNIVFDFQGSREIDR